MNYLGRLISTIAFVSALFLSIGCSQQHEMKNRQSNVVSSVQKAIAVLHPTKGNSVTGTVIFSKVDSGIKINVHITGLTPGQHGFHIHEFGDCSADDATSSGGHFNPTQMPHGAPTDSQRHSGDFGNDTADSSGVAVLEWIDPMIAFEGANSIIGRAVIVHADKDDLTSQPTGAAGARVACGVIGIDDNK
jgi:Cu-Zn family superoxide dismutase